MACSYSGGASNLGHLGATIERVYLKPLCWVNMQLVFNCILARKSVADGGLDFVTLTTSVCDCIAVKIHI